MGKDVKRQLFSALSFASSVGFTLVSHIALGLFLGRWVDEKLEISPIVAFIGIIFGMITGVWSTYRWIVKDFIKG